METVLSIIHVVAAIFMILVVLLQAGKGAGMGAAFGGASQTAFGASSGMTFLGKLTAIAATVFMLTSMSLAYISSKTSSVVDDVKQEPVVEEPATPPAAAPAAVPVDTGNTAPSNQGNTGEEN